MHQRYPLGPRNQTRRPLSAVHIRVLAALRWVGRGLTQRGCSMSTMDRTTIWVWRDDAWSDDRGNLDGFSVEAVDGSIGKIDEATYEVGDSYIVVDTGPWIFGKKVLLPAGVIERVDHNDEQVFVSLTKDQIKDSPEFDELTYRDDAYRSSL